MRERRLRAGRWRIALLALLLLIGTGGALWLWLNRAPPEDQPIKTQGETVLDQDPGISGVATVEVATDATLAAATTPMRERVAVLGFLNKRSGAARDLTLKPGEAIRVGDAVVRLRACETTAPWEPDQFTGGFVQLDRLMPDRKWRRVFSGWLYRERPSLNVVVDPVYDVTIKSCAMRFPEGGPDSVAVSNGAGPRSSAAKSPEAADGNDSAAAPEAPAAAPAPVTAPPTAEASSPR